MGVNKNDLLSQFVHSTGDGGIDYLRLLKKNSLQKDSISGTGPYVAQVLRVEKFTLGSGESWLNDIKINLSYNNSKTTAPTPNPLDNKRWVRVYARITGDYLPGQPNIHAYIPMPTQLGSVSDLKNDHRSNTLITMHTAFLGSVENAELPTPGDFVWVDYLDKSNLLKPVFIEKILTSAGGQPCLDGTCAPPSLAYAPPKGPALNNPQNASVANTSVREPNTADPEFSKRPGDRPYELKVYEASDFTSYDEYLTGQYQGAFHITLSIMEIITFHFENAYPKDEITIKPNKNPGIAYPPQKLFNTQENRHHTGKAFDVEIYRNGEPIDKAIIWASLLKLIEAGKIPDGGVGFYQTNADKGPNAGMKTTFGTDALPSDWPHYDWDTSGNRPAKWLEGTIDDKEVVFSSTALGKWETASKWIQATKDGLNHMPPYCVEALMSPKTTVHPSLPTYEDALAAREEVERTKTHNTTKKNVVRLGLAVGISLATPLGTAAALAMTDLKLVLPPIPPLYTEGGFSGQFPTTLSVYPRGEIDVNQTTLPDGSTQYTPRINTCVGATGKGAKLVGPMSEEKLKLLNTAANLPPGFLIDQNVMSKAGKEKLKNVSIFVVHEVGAEVTPRAICLGRVKKIGKGGLKGVKYTTGAALAIKNMAEGNCGPRPNWNRDRKTEKNPFGLTYNDYAKVKAAWTKCVKKKKQQLEDYNKGIIRSRRVKDINTGKMKTVHDTPPSTEDRAKLAKETEKTIAGAKKISKKKLAEAKANVDAAQKARDKAVKERKSRYAAYKAAAAARKGTKGAARTAATKLMSTTKSAWKSATKNAAAARRALGRAKGKFRVAYRRQGKVGSAYKGGIRVRVAQGKEGESYWSPNKNVHFWSGRAGEIVVGSDWSRVLAHGNWSNPWSVGNENCTGWGGYVSTNKKRMTSYMKQGGKSIGSPTAFWGPVHPKRNKEFFLQLGIYGQGWHGGYGRVMPNQILMERQYQLTQWLASPFNPYSDIYTSFDPNFFPCTLNSKHSPFKTWGAIQGSLGKNAQTLIGQALTTRSGKLIRNEKSKKVKRQKSKYNKRINKLLRQQKHGVTDKETGEMLMIPNPAFANIAAKVQTNIDWYDIKEPLFCWGFFSPDRQLYGRKGRPHPGGWKKGLRRRGQKIKHEWQKGITAHTRWGPHTDGCIIEYYILGRVLGLNPDQAFYACVGAWCSSSSPTRGKSGVINPILAFPSKPALKHPPRQFTYFPDNEDADYISLGHAIWHGDPGFHTSRKGSQVANLYTPNQLAAMKKAGTTIKGTQFAADDNPLNWPIARGSLYDPKAKIPVVDGAGIDFEHKIPANRAHMDKKKRVKINGKWKYIYFYGEGQALPGPFASNSHFSAEPGTRASIIPNPVGWTTGLEFLKPAKN